MEDAYVLQMKNRKFSDFYICFCGYAKCRPLHSFGPAVRPNYILHYIVEGKGKFLVNDEEYSLQKGQGFLIEPEVQTFYQADLEEPWTYLWIGFGGERAGEYLRDLGLNKKQLTYQCSCGDELKEIVHSMLKHKKYTVANEYLLEGLLYTFFGVLTENMEVSGSAAEKDSNLYVRKAVEFIQNNYADPIMIKDIADYVGVNRSYLYTLFQDNLKLSPKEYLTNFRITRAAELLQITDLSIESVAMSCGYQDALGFSKIFKIKKGVIPSEYRKQNANWQQKKRKEEINLTF